MSSWKHLEQTATSTFIRGLEKYSVFDFDWENLLRAVKVARMTPITVGSLEDGMRIEEGSYVCYGSYICVDIWQSMGMDGRSWELRYQ